MAGELWELVKTNNKGEVISRCLRTPYFDYAKECADKWNSNNIHFTEDLSLWCIRKIERGE